MVPESAEPDIVRDAYAVAKETGALPATWGAPLPDPQTPEERQLLNLKVNACNALLSMNYHIGRGEFREARSLMTYVKRYMKAVGYPLADA